MRISIINCDGAVCQDRLGTKHIRKQTLENGWRFFRAQVTGSLATCASSRTAVQPPARPVQEGANPAATWMSFTTTGRTKRKWLLPTKIIILPRQARDKRRESTQTKHGFCFLVSQGRRSTRFCSTSTWTEGTASHTTATGQFAAGG